MRRIKRQHGFTLVELVIAIAISSLLIVGVIAGQNATRSNALLTGAIDQLKNQVRSIQNEASHSVNIRAGRGTSSSGRSSVIFGKLVEFDTADNTHVKVSTLVGDENNLNSSSLSKCDTEVRTLKDGLTYNGVGNPTPATGRKAIIYTRSPERTFMAPTNYNAVSPGAVSGTSAGLSPGPPCSPGTVYDPPAYHTPSPCPSGQVQNPGDTACHCPPGQADDGSGGCTLTAPVITKTNNDPATSSGAGPKYTTLPINITVTGATPGNTVTVTDSNSGSSYQGTADSSGVAIVAVNGSRGAYRVTATQSSGTSTSAPSNVAVFRYIPPHGTPTLTTSTGVSISGSYYTSRTSVDYQACGQKGDTFIFHQGSRTNTVTPSGTCASTNFGTFSGSGQSYAVYVTEVDNLDAAATQNSGTITTYYYPPPTTPPSARPDTTYSYICQYSSGIWYFATPSQGCVAGGSVWGNNAESGNNPNWNYPCRVNSSPSTFVYGYRSSGYCPSGTTKDGVALKSADKPSMIVRLWDVSRQVATSIARYIATLNVVPNARAAVVAGCGSDTDDILNPNNYSEGCSSFTNANAALQLQFGFSDGRLGYLIFSHSDGSIDRKIP